MEPIKVELLKPELFKVVEVRAKVMPGELETWEYEYAKWDGCGWRDRDDRRLMFAPEEWQFMGAGFVVGE